MPRYLQSATTVKNHLRNCPLESCRLLGARSPVHDTSMELGKPPRHPRVRVRPALCRGTGTRSLSLTTPAGFSHSEMGGRALKQRVPSALTRAFSLLAFFSFFSSLLKFPVIIVNLSQLYVSTLKTKETSLSFFFSPFQALFLGISFNSVFLLKDNYNFERPC